MSKNITIFSVAFILTVCVFWMKIQVGQCEDNLDVWMSTTKQEAEERARDAYYETENKDAPIQPNLDYQNNLNRTSFDVESNQVNELDELVHEQRSKSDSPLYMSVPNGDWIPEERRNPMNIPSIRSSKEKFILQTTDSKENSDRLQPISKHKKRYSRIANRKRTTKFGRTHPIILAKNEERYEKYNEKHESEERTTNFNNDERTTQLESTPPVEHIIYEQGQKTHNSDAETEARDNPINKANDDNFASQELLPVIENMMRTQNSIEGEQYVIKSTTELLTETERVEETERPFRINLGVVNKKNNKDDYISSIVKSEFDLRENKKPNVHHKRNKQPARSGKESVSQKTRQKLRSFHKRTASVNSLKYLAPHSLKKQLGCIAKAFESKAIIDQEVIGRTVEYNDIILWKIRELPDNRKGFKHKNMRSRPGRGSKYADDKPEKKIVFIVHGLNVMGWHKLKCLSEVKSFKKLLGFYLDNLDCFDIFLIPMANPDGVQISASQGYWNKNVSPQKACPGVNLDRNFDVGWNASYAKISSCSQQFPGPRALSEHETKAIREIFNLHGHRMVAFFHVHSSTYDTTTFRGDAVLYPKGYTDAQTDDDRYIDFKGELDEAMRNTSFKVLGVTVDTLHSWYGKVIGTSVDYASTIYGIPFAFDFSMQIYDDDTMVTKEEDREQNTALVELWQIVIDVAFSHIHNTTEKTEK